MADVKKVILVVRNAEHDISYKKLERRAAIAKRKHPEAEITIRIVNR